MLTNRCALRLSRWRNVIYKRSRPQARALAPPRDVVALKHAALARQGNMFTSTNVWQKRNASQPADRSLRGVVFPVLPRQLGVRRLFFLDAASAGHSRWRAKNEGRRSNLAIGRRAGTPRGRVSAFRV